MLDALSASDPSSMARSELSAGRSLMLSTAASKSCGGAQIMTSSALFSSNRLAVSKNTVTALSTIVDRNGVAIVATHSPVVLQEVPNRCVWKVRRAGRQVNAERPAVETFGENVGVLTPEIFGLEVTHSGFHRLLQESVNTYNDYEAVLEDFNGEIGAEGRAIVRSLLAAID